MTPIEPKTVGISERSKKVQEEIQAFIDANCECAEVWKDETVGTGRNVDIYKKELRVMRIPYGIYEVVQRQGRVIIKKKGVIV